MLVLKVRSRSSSGIITSGVGFRWASAEALTSPTTSSIVTQGRPAALNAISVVCKVRAVNGRPAVKLSDDYLKAAGPQREVAAYRVVFGHAGIRNAPLAV